MCDADKNGVLERVDYERLADRLIAANKMQATSPVATRIRGSYLEMWSRMEKLADANKDGKVTLTEFLASLGEIFADKSLYTQLVTQQSAAIVEMTDHDRDGKIQEADFVANLVAYGQKEDAARAAFKKLDRNSDGVLTNDELLAAVEEFCFSEDPAARGNWLLGPL
jgi:Ca2+-binding EF-hand superfamily protein